MLKQLLHKLIKKYFSWNKNRHFTRKMPVFVEAIPTPVFWIDHNKTYQGCNQVFSDLIGLTSPLDIVGLSDKDLPYSSEDLNMRDDIFDSILNNQASTKILYDCILGISDKIIWIQKRFTPLKNRRGKIIGVLGTVIDISEKVNLRKELDSLVEHKIILESLLKELNTTPILSQNYKELIEKSITNLQKESQASCVVVIKEKATSVKNFLRYTSQDINTEFFFKNRSAFFKMKDQSGYLSEEIIKEFKDMDQPVNSIFYYRIRLNDFVKYDEVILLINPHKDKLNGTSTYFNLTHLIISYFHVSRFMATAKQLSQHIKNTTNSSN